MTLTTALHPFDESDLVTYSEGISLKKKRINIFFLFFFFYQIVILGF